MARRHSSAHRRRSSSNLLQHNHHASPVSQVGYTNFIFAEMLIVWWQHGGSVPNCLGLGRSGSPLNSRHNSTIGPSVVPSHGHGSQSPLSWSRKSRYLPYPYIVTMVSQCHTSPYFCSMCDPGRGYGTPPSTPPSLLQQTFNNVVSAATSISNSCSAVRSLARHPSYPSQSSQDQDSFVWYDGLVWEQTNITTLNGWWCLDVNSVPVVKWDKEKMNWILFQWLIWYV